MANNYNILADYIADRFIARISGDDIEETFVDDEDFDRVMTGMIAAKTADQRFEGGYDANMEKRYESVPSMSITFTVKKNIGGVLRVKPHGLLFYTVTPDYGKTVDYLISRYSEKDNRVYNSIHELMNLYPNETFQMPLTYKKLDLGKRIKDGIELRLDDMNAGTFSLQEKISEKIGLFADEVMEELRITPACFVKFCDILTPERFRAKLSVKDERVYPNWDFDIYCSVYDEGDCFRIMMQLVNNTIVHGNASRGYISTIFNAGLTVTGNDNIEYQEIELGCFVSSFKQRDPVYVIAENTSAYLDKEKNAICTDNVPKYYQKRLVTRDTLAEFVTFDKLIADPVGSLEMILSEMQKDLQRCRSEFSCTSFKTDSARNGFREALHEYEAEINRFRSGLDQLRYKDFVKNAFVFMNKTFSCRLNDNQRVFPGWRVFQVVFIVSLIPEMIRSQFVDDSTLAITDMEVANLLYFPTGGGKTEAFLGAAIFSMFFDRIRGKENGVTSLIKYPLRLLAVQQLDRILTVVMKADAIRRSEPSIAETNPFRVGFFVGKENTPNKIDTKEQLSDRGKKNASNDPIVDADTDTLNEWYRFIDTCPCCGKKTVNVRFNRQNWCLEHYCDNPECEIDALPLYIVDDEIYRYLPSIIVSTIDKLSLLGTTNGFRSLLGQVKTECPVHGYSVTRKCGCIGCSETMRSVSPLKDPVPTLFIQDELHLVNESLGTFDSHYESFIDYYAQNLVPKSQRKRIRFIGATATISGYKDHIQNLYHMEARRFPCVYPSVKTGTDFYSRTDEDDISRIMLGFAPYGRSVTEGMWQSVTNVRVIVYELMRNAEQSLAELSKAGFDASLDELKEMLFDYWVELVYVNVKQDSNELQSSISNQANNLLTSKGVPLFKTELMTSDVDFQQVRKTLFDIQANHKNLESTNAILATKTISHGVDEDSFNVMFFFGIPNNNAEYIQAYSRTGRKYTGIVIDIIRLLRVRDRSYLKNFVIFHQNKEDLVESVPLNRWAKNAVHSTLPGILAGLLMQYYTVATGSDSFFFVKDLRKCLVDGTIDIEEVVAHLQKAYGCNDGEKASIAYADIIRSETTNILEGIRNGRFDPDAKLGDCIAKFSKGKRAPMKSLRDTEESVYIKLG